MVRSLFYGTAIQLLLSCCFASFIVGDTPLPRASTAIAVGYDSSNDTILLLGGYDSAARQQFVTFKDHQFVDIGPTAEMSAQGWSQHYTQINHQLWILRADGAGFLRVNTKTHHIETPSITLPNTDDASCLTSTQQYLIVIGPSWITTTVQMYNMKANRWLSNVPSIGTERKRVSCVVANGKVYVIGGYYTGLGPILMDTITTLDISYTDLISSQQWTVLSGKLPTPRTATRAVVYGTNTIYVIGGSDYWGFTAYSDVSVIDTETGECSIVDTLAIGVGFTSAIEVRSILYVFSGAKSGSVFTDKYQYSLLPTTNPTVYPTEQPHVQTTDYPTERPHVQTTDYPTEQPSATVITTDEVRNTKLTIVTMDGTSREIGTPDVDKYNEQMVLVIILSVVVVCACIVVMMGVSSKLGFKPKLRIDHAEPPERAEEEANVEMENADAIGSVSVHSHSEIDRTIIVRSDSEIANTRATNIGSNTTLTLQSGETQGMKGNSGEFNIEGIEYDVNKSGANAVKSWLDSIGESTYFEAFIQNGFDSMDLIKQINEMDDLKGIGISLRAHQLKIVNEIKILKH